MSLTLTIIGQAIEILGIMFIFLAQIKFIFEAKKEFNGVDRYFIFISGTFLMDSLEDTKQYSIEKVRDAFKKNPKARMFYNNWRETVIGLFFALFGQLIQLVGSM